MGGAVFYGGNRNQIPQTQIPIPRPKAAPTPAPARPEPQRRSSPVNPYDGPYPASTTAPFQAPAPPAPVQPPAPPAPAIPSAPPMVPAPSQGAGAPAMVAAAPRANGAGFSSMESAGSRGAALGTRPGGSPALDALAALGGGGRAY